MLKKKYTSTIEEEKSSMGQPSKLNNLGCNLTHLCTDRKIKHLHSLRCYRNAATKRNAI